MLVYVTTFIASFFVGFVFGIIVTILSIHEKRRKRGVEVWFIVTDNSGITKIERSGSMRILQAGKSFHCTVQGFDEFGNVAPLENLRFSSSSEEHLTVTPDAEGTGATFTSTGKMTPNVQAQVMADVIVGEGVQDVLGLLDVQVVPGQAVVVALTPDPQ